MEVKLTQAIWMRCCCFSVEIIRNLKAKQLIKCFFAVFIRLCWMCLIFNTAQAHAAPTSAVFTLKPPSARFLTLDSSLPANARGVLFQQDLGNTQTQSLIDGKIYYFVNHAPVPLTSGDVLAFAAGRKIPLIVKRLQSVSGTERVLLRVLLIRDQNLFRCLTTGVSDTAACGAAYAPPKTGADVESMIQSGAAEDVSASFDQMVGLFRLEPEFGFEEGLDYVFKDVRGENSFSKAEKNQIRIKIDPPIIRERDSEFLLKTKEPTLRDNLISFPISVEFPKKFEEYEQLVSLEIEHSAINQVLKNVSSQNFHLTNRLDVHCSNYRQAPQGVVQVRGRAKFLEFSDDEFVTPTIEIKMDISGRSRCDFDLARDDKGNENSRISFKDDDTLCSIKNASHSWVSEGEQPNFDRLSFGGEILPKRELLLRILNTPKVTEAEAYPACFFGALSKLAGESDDPVIAERTLNIFTSMLGSKAWAENRNISEQYFDYVRQLRKKIDSSLAMPDQKNRFSFQVFSTSVQKLVQHMDELHPIFVRRILEAMGPSSADAVPLLLAKKGIFFDWGAGKLLLSIAPNDPRVIRQLLVETENMQSNKLRGLLSQFARKLNDPELLSFVAQNSSSIEVDMEALAVLQSQAKYQTIYENELIAFAKRKLSGDDTNSQSTKHTQQLIKMLVAIENRDRELIDVLMSAKWNGMLGLSMMGKRAHAAAPKLVNRFKDLTNLHKFDLLDEVMVNIQSPTKLRKQAYMFAQESPDSEVRAAAHERSLALKSSARRRQLH